MEEEWKKKTIYDGVPGNQLDVPCGKCRSLGWGCVLDQRGQQGYATNKSDLENNSFLFIYFEHDGSIK